LLIFANPGGDKLALRRRGIEGVNQIVKAERAVLRFVRT
jgi:hypothetical protein